MECTLQRFSEIKDDIVVLFKRTSLIPIVGSGISCGASTPNGRVPSGEEFKNHMLQKLEELFFSDEEQRDIRQASFSSLCDYYDEFVDEDTRLKYLRDNFYNAHLCKDKRLRFFEIEWPYIYSLNIDDAIERSTVYSNVILPRRKLRVDFNEKNCLIKLHGDIRELSRYQDADKIFSSIEYAHSINNNRPLLDRLRNDYKNQNILYVGCSLADEFDLKTLGKLPIEFQNKERLRKTIIFVKGKPGKLKIAQYKTYGITNIVYFDDYDSMYVELYNAWRESQCIGDNDIVEYEDFSMKYLQSTQGEKNYEYFFWGKGLLKDKQFTYPFFFISRHLTSVIIDNFYKNTIHIISGGRVSGKSYILADIYSRIRDRRVCFFDGKVRISDAALKKLLEYQNTVCIFDTASIERKQFRTILESIKLIHENKSNFIVCINANDRDLKGIIQIKRDEDAILNTLEIYNLKNKFDSGNEEEDINGKLPLVNLPAYNKTQTVLDYIIKSEYILDRKSCFTASYSISIETIKELIFCIILATKEKMTTLDVINFDLEEEALKAKNKYAPFIEKIETLNYEKSFSDMSSIKYVLNSKFWLQRQLYTYVKEFGHENVSEAYMYIVKLIIDMVPDVYRQRHLYRDFIMFDTINGLFISEFGGNIRLIVDIYKNLHNIIATDYNFLHQYAKCLIHYSNKFDSSDSEKALEKESLLKKARVFANVAESMAEKIYNDIHSETVLISIAHIQFSLASILCSLCRLHGYSNVDELDNAMLITTRAISSQYNRNLENKISLSQNIFEFLNVIQRMAREGVLDDSLSESFGELIKVLEKKIEYKIKSADYYIEQEF